MAKKTAAHKLKELQEKVKKRVANKNKLSEEAARANEVAQMYEQALGIYKHKPALRYLKKGLVDETKKSVYKTWLRAASFVEELNVDAQTYVIAQFYYFNKWFNRAPKVSEMATYKTKTNAKERVKMYLQEKKVVAPVYSPATEYVPATSREDNFRDSEMSLKTLMKNFNKSEEDVLKVFAKPEIFDIHFDREWLLSNQTYIKLVESGEIQNV